MRLKRAMSLAGFSLCIVGAAVQLGGCSSVPKPAEADGSLRVPANDRQLLSENNLLRAQVDVLQTKLNEMTSIVREALTLPPAQCKMPAPALPLPIKPPPAASKHSMAKPAVPPSACASERIDSKRVQ